jgi:serine/threonine-protein kinase HipA
MASTRTLVVYLDGTPIGEVGQSPQGALSFIYIDEYRNMPDATPLSLSMPLAADRHRNKTVRAYLEGLLPDSEATRQRWAQQYAVSPNNPFALLGQVGRDAAGAVQLLPPGEDATDALERQGDIDWLSDDEFATTMREVAVHDDNWDPGRFGGRWSLSGAQPKIALFQDPQTGRYGIPLDSTPTNRIIKPAIEGFARHNVNEALCLRAAREAGLLAARIELIEDEDVAAIISHRYDRFQDEAGRWVRVHQEDMCQALSVTPSLKYQTDGGPGVADIGDLLLGFPAADRLISAERFAKGLIFNILIGGADAHAKNYSLVLIGDRAQVAPLYDVASAACYPQYERLDSPMKVGHHWKFLDIGADDWKRAARQLDVAPRQMLVWVEELRDALPDAFDRAVATLPTRVQEEAAVMAGRIVEHVRGTWRPDLDRNPRHVLRGTSTFRTSD